MRGTLAGVVGLVLASHVAIGGPRPAPNPDVGGMPDPGDLGAPPSPSNDLDRSAIVAAMASARSRLMACGDQLVAGGTLRAKVKVAPSGKVATATAEGIDDPALQACVVKVVKTLRFPKSDNGGAFSYPLAFHAADLSDTLDAQVIAQGLAKLEAKIAACRKASKMTQASALKIDVSAAGKVTKVWTYGASGDAKADACVERVFKAARFAKTADSGSFVYPRPLDVNAIAPATTSASAGDLDRAAIADGVAKVKDKIAACGATSRVGGTVKAKVQVGADGTVTSSTAEGSTDDALNVCVSNVLRWDATFAKTKSGGAFDYPFVFAPGGSDGLTRDEMMAGIVNVFEKIMACGKASVVGGSVNVHLEVGPDGKVKSITTDGSADPQVGACIAAVIKSITFPTSKLGGTLTDGFDFSEPNNPVFLDDTVMMDGLTKAKQKVHACGEASKVGGTVKLGVYVGADGKVLSVRSEGSADAQLNTCVAAAIRATSFGKTKSGGIFNLTLPFGAAKP